VFAEGAGAGGGRVPGERIGSLAGSAAAMASVGPREMRGGPEDVEPVAATGRGIRESAAGRAGLVASGMERRVVSPGTSDASLPGASTGEARAVRMAARESAQVSLAASGGEALARPVEERYAALPLKVETPKSICELPLIAAGLDRRPIPPGLDNISASAGALDVEQAPRYHPRNIQPSYPLAAIAQSLSGRVVVRAEVSSEGQVGRSWIKHTSGERILDDAALSTVRAWLFLPARRNGHPVTAWVDVPIEYRSPSIYRN
jgi:TonB family protein